MESASDIDRILLGEESNDGENRLELHIRIPGAPVGDQRPFTVRKKDGSSYRTKQDKSVKWALLAMELVRDRWVNAEGKPRPLLTGPVVLDVLAVIARPATSPTWMKGLDDEAAWKAMWRSGKRMPCGAKPDEDNILKLVQDSLKNAGVVFEDQRVWDGRCRKYYAAVNEQPFVELWLSRTIPPEPPIEQPKGRKAAQSALFGP
jgi:Holliday junction resolvase RusA-like endonuclease